MSARKQGLTLIEVLVAIAMLGLISAAIVGSFTLLRTINSAAEEEVDYTRAVRSAYERIRLEWLDPSLFEAEQIGADLTAKSVADFVSEDVSSACTAEVFDDPEVGGDLVKRVRITCEGAGNGPDQVYETEFGRP
jgi:prepilin-type N-terminal cleavage/methylation domain-containing protein